MWNTQSAESHEKAVRSELGAPAAHSFKVGITWTIARSPSVNWGSEVWVSLQSEPWSLGSRLGFFIWSCFVCGRWWCYVGLVIRMRNKGPIQVDHRICFALGQVSPGPSRCWWKASAWTREVYEKSLAAWRPEVLLISSAYWAYPSIKYYSFK